MPVIIGKPLAVERAFLERSGMGFTAGIESVAPARRFVVSQFSKTRPGASAIPQGLKPLVFMAFIGTSELVPYKETSMQVQQDKKSPWSSADSHPSDKNKDVRWMGHPAAKDGKFRDNNSDPNTSGFEAGLYTNSHSSRHLQKGTKHS
jgi:hypothetical protein